MVSGHQTVPEFVQVATSPTPLTLRLVKSFGWLAPVSLFALFTILYTFPMVFHFTTEVPGVRFEDRMQNLWNFWWMRRTLTSGHNPFHTDMLFFPYFSPPNNSLPLYFHTLQLFNGVVTLPLQLFGGITAAYNGTVFLAIFFSGLGTYLLIRRLGGSALAAVVGGSLFTFAPIRMQTIQQSITNIQSTEFLPIYALCLYAARRKEDLIRPGFAGFWLSLDKKWLAGAILAFTCCVYTDWYNTLYLVTYTLIYVCWRSLSRPLGLRKIYSEFGFISLVAVGVFILTAPMVLPGIGQLNNPAFKLALGYDFEIKGSAPLPTLFLPGTVSLNFATTWSGYASLILIPFALGALFRLKGSPTGWLVRSTGIYWLVVAAVGFIMMLGPEIKLDDKTTTHIPAPYALFRLLPIVSFTRAEVRFIILAMLGLAVGSAFGLDWLRTIIKPRKFGLISARIFPNVICLGMALLVMGYLVLETWSPLQLFSTAGKPFFEAMKGEAGNFSLLELPITRHYNKDMVRMFNQISHEKPIMGGYLTRPVFDYYRTPDSSFLRVANLAVQPDKIMPSDIIPVTNTMDDIDSLSLLYNFRYIIIYKKEYDYPLQAQTAIATINQHYGSQQLVYEDEDIVAYRVPDNLSKKLSPVRLDLGDGWYNIEKVNSTELWRWTGAESSFYATSYATQKVTLKLRISSFGVPRTLQLKLNGQNVANTDITPGPATTVSFELELPQGRNVFTLDSLQGDQLPKELFPNNSDSRRLAFQIFSMNFDCEKCKN